MDRFHSSANKVSHPFFSISTIRNVTKCPPILKLLEDVSGGGVKYPIVTNFLLHFPVKETETKILPSG